MFILATSFAPSVMSWSVRLCVFDHYRSQRSNAGEKPTNKQKKDILLTRYVWFICKFKKMVPTGKIYT